MVAEKADRNPRQRAEKRQYYDGRIRFFGVLFVLLFLAVVARSVYLQIVIAPDLQARAEQQSQQIIELAPQRGTIYDRNGDELAVSLAAESLFADPASVKDPSATAAKLAPLLKKSAAEIERLLKKNKRFVWLERKLEPSVASQVRERFNGRLSAAGLNFVSERKRYYPQEQTAAHLLGFTGLDPKGLEGLELEYDRQLQGEAGRLVSSCDARRRGLAVEGQAVQGGEEGFDLHLTLDRSLQYVAEKELARVVAERGAVAGTVVMMEPASGRILALASQPDYNPNMAGSYRAGQRRNRAVSDIFEPGSTFKPFLAAAVLEEKAASLSEKINCENGRYTVSGKTIRDHGKKYDWLTIPEILKVSSNIGSAKLAERLGRERFYRYIRDFGFGEPTGIDLPGEVGGIVRPASGWFDIDLANIAFGQGVGVTSLQVATAMSVIANGGVLMQPYLVEKVTDADGQLVQKRLPEPRRRVISEKTAATLRQLLVAVTEKGGTAPQAALPGFRVAGKTGTAQKVDPVTGGYSPDKRVSSFVGMVPADHPALVISVMVDEPKGMTYGGVVAGPVFSRIAGQSLNHLNILPKGSLEMVALAENPAPEPLPDLARLIPAAGQSDGLTMPDFRGKSYREVLQIMQLEGLNLKLSGSGRAVGQSPRPGRVIEYGQQAWVKFGA